VIFAGTGVARDLAETSCANDEARMTNDEGLHARLLHYSDFIIPSSFNASPARTIRHSSF
jgi:hypothetical protein